MKRVAIPSLLLSAFLLFYVQPFAGRLVLPYFGSSASVWIVCLAFFQVLLLAGYLYADRLSRAPVRVQALVHGALVAAAAFATLRLADLEAMKRLAAEAGSSAQPTLALLGLLLALVGPAYFALATNGPLMQAWIGRERGDHIERRTVYRFYALSNIGSFVGLFAYPLVVEPFAGLATQSRGFVIAFGVYALATLAAAARLLVRGAAGRLHDGGEAAAAVGGAAKAEAPMGVFLLNAFAATFLLMAATQHLTIDIPPVPLLWALLLGLYLLSFTLGFSETAVKWLPAITTTSLVLIPVEAYLATGIAAKRGLGSVWQIASCVVLLLLGCLAVNAWQYKLRPAQGLLPRFYLMLSLGGAAAGVFSSLVAPLVFSGTPEYPMALVATSVLLAWLLARDRAPGRRLPNRALLAPAATAAALLAGIYGGTPAEPAVWQKRDFYGSITIRRLEGAGARGQPLRFHNLCHGNTSHGSQMWSADGRAANIPISCFSDRSGIGRFLQAGGAAPARKVGVIGLGIGTLTAYGRPGDTYRYYEIAPLILEAATNTTWFTFLRDTPAAVEHVLGDARLSLGREQTAGGSQGYDLIVGDAFSSDAIPTHLLTLEAFQLYAAHLKADGVVAVNLTNRYIDLLPVAKAAAKALGWHFAAHVSQGQGMIVSSTWVFLSPKPVDFDAGEHGVFVDPLRIPEIAAWTDDFHGIWPLLRLGW
jgi:hypothetical protein